MRPYEVSSRDRVPVEPSGAMAARDKFRHYPRPTLSRPQVAPLEPGAFVLRGYYYQKKGLLFVAKGAVMATTMWLYALRTIFVFWRNAVNTFEVILPDIVRIACGKPTQTSLTGLLHP